MVRKLPIVDGYTVDERLKEFRKMEFGKEPEFIHFGSEQGIELLKKYECCKQFCNQLDEWIQDEENATKEYHSWAKKAEKKEPYVSAILETLSADESKHAQVLTKVAMLVCEGI